MRPHILVLGANGFVGSHFVHQALQLGWKVDGAKRPSVITSHFESIKNYYENLQNPEFSLLNSLKTKLSNFSDEGYVFDPDQNTLTGEFKWIDVDLNDTINIIEILQTPYDIVVNTAAMISFNISQDAIMIETNTQITQNIVNACLEAKISKLIHFSSIAALGRPENNEDITINDTWSDSEFNTPYALSKHLSEMEVWRGAHEGLNVLILNPGVILGYSKAKTSSTQVIDAANSANPFVPQGSNGFIFVEDLVARTLQLIEDPDNWQRRHLMVSHNISFQQMFKTINEVHQIKRTKLPLKQPVFGIVYTLLKLFQFFNLPLPLSTHLLKSTRKESRYDNRIGHTQSRKFA